MDNPVTEMERRLFRRLTPHVARWVGLVVVPVGFVVLATGLAAYTSFLEDPGAARTGLLQAALGAGTLLVGLVLVDRGYGRGARPFGPLVPTMRVEPVPITHPDAARLVTGVQAEYAARYGDPDETPLDARAFVPPQGAFFVGYLDDEAIAIGAWRRREDLRVFETTNVGEIKRMYVVPAAQRRGHARAMLAHLEATLAEAGAEVAILETGTLQPEAIALYESSGYTRIDSFGHYQGAPEQRCYGRRLVPVDPHHRE